MFLPRLSFCDKYTTGMTMAWLVAHGRSFQRAQIVSVFYFCHFLVSRWLLLQVSFIQPLSFALYCSCHRYTSLVRVKRTSTTHSRLLLHCALCTLISVTVKAVVAIRDTRRCRREVEASRKTNQFSPQTPQLFMQFSLIQVKYLESFLQSPVFTQPWHFSGEWYLSLQAVK